MTHSYAPEDFRVGCVILAAGAGTRFGEPKAGALLSDGTRFVDAIAESARSAGIEDIIVVMHPSLTAPQGVRTVINREPTSEQIASLRLGLAQLVNVPAKGTLVWPVDHPFVRDTTVVKLLDFVRRSNPLIAVPLHEGRRGHPGYFSRNVWRELATVTEGGAKAVMRQFASEVAEVVVNDAGVLRNIDSRKDLESDV